ncbi:MAG: ATP-binding protein [Defluviicoccus sp.]|nr:ATP-binding protein [Defluviicoccus sp.]MDG4591917.1 ATP-binding protein [Defluviicoccus sp.]MDS4009948.1 ATP-binding protein [Defluviicoccus sp.]MDS4073061.1 ATP-binding protein [Defluviicoccus sp.]
MSTGLPRVAAAIGVVMVSGEGLLSMDGNAVFVIEESVGRVASVTGSQIIVHVKPDPQDSQLPGASAVVKGTLVKIRRQSTWVFGLVTAISIPLPSHEQTPDEQRFAEVLLLGEADVGTDPGTSIRFERGVSFFPSVGAQVYVATADDLALVYAKRSPTSVRIGTIHQDRSILAYVSPDRLLGKHFAVLGTTGTGKSCAVALILRRIVETHRNAHILVLDPHNEYASAFGDYAEIIDASSFELPYWLFNFEELRGVILGDVSRDEDLQREATALATLICRAKEAFLGNTKKAPHITVNTPVPYKMSELLSLLDAEMGKLGHSRNVLPLQNLKNKINSFRSDSRYAFMFGGIATSDNMSRILSRIFRIPVGDKPISILDLSAVPSEILNIVVSVVARITFDLAVFSERSVPILLVCEEAHRYLPADDRQGFEPTKRILSRIAREGRKYGVALGIISQRPSDLAISALCQCNSIFALRLSNTADQEFVRAMLPDWGGGLFDFLPALRNGEAIVLGEAVPVPARVRFDTLPPEHMPCSKTAPFSEAWQTNGAGKDLLEGVIARWRAEH